MISVNSRLALDRSEIHGLFTRLSVSDEDLYLTI